MELSLGMPSPSPTRSPAASPRAALGTITNSPRQDGATATPRSKAPRGTPRRQRSLSLAAQRPSFPYLKRPQDEANAATDAENPTVACQATPSKEQLGSVLSALRVAEPELGVKKLKAKVQEQQPTWKVGCKQIRNGLQSTPVRAAMRERMATAPAAIDTDMIAAAAVAAPAAEPAEEVSMLAASFRTSSLNGSAADLDELERSKSEGSLVDTMRALLDADASLDRPIAAPSPLPLVERMKAAAVTAAHTVDSVRAADADPVPQVASAAKPTARSTRREKLVPPPPPRRDYRAPPALPPRDHMVGAINVLRLGLRWKARAMQAAAARAAQATVQSDTSTHSDVEAATESDELTMNDSTTASTTEQDEPEELDPAAEERRRAFLQTATSAVLASPVMHSSQLAIPQDWDDEDRLMDKLASPTVEARSRRSAFLRQELTENALLNSAEKFIAARTLSSLEELQMSPLRTLSWSDDPVETTESSSSNSSEESTPSDGEMSYEQLTAKLLSAAQVAPSAESRSYLTQLFKTMTGLADQRDRHAEQLEAANARADESEAKLKELQAWVQSFAARPNSATPSTTPSSFTELQSELLPTPAPRVASIVAAQDTVPASSAPPLQEQQRAQRKKARARRGGGIGCACGSRPAAPPASPPQSARGGGSSSEQRRPGTDWVHGIFERYAEDPSVSTRILVGDGAEEASSQRRRLASAALADLVEIIYLPRLAKLDEGPVPHATTPLLALLPTTEWDEAGPEWAALTSKFGLKHGFAGGFTCEQYTAWDVAVAQECGVCVSAAAATAAASAAAAEKAAAAPKRRWGRRGTKSKSTPAAAAATPAAQDIAQYMCEHYAALETGGEHELTQLWEQMTTSGSSSSTITSGASTAGSSRSLPPPPMPTVSVEPTSTSTRAALQDEATQDAIASLEAEARR